MHALQDRDVRVIAAVGNVDAKAIDGDAVRAWTTRFSDHGPRAWPQAFRTLDRFDEPVGLDVRDQREQDERELHSDRSEWMSVSGQDQLSDASGERTGQAKRKSGQTG